MKKQKLIAASIVALSCFGIFVMVLPMYNSINAARDDLSARQEVLKNRTELISQVSKWNGEYQKYADQISKLDVLLPEKKQSDQIVSSIQEISNQSGLILTELGVADITQSSQNNYKSNLISASLTGTYPQFMGFLKNLEQSLRIYDINKISVSEVSSGGLSRGSGLNFQLKINTNSIK